MSIVALDANYVVHLAGPVEEEGYQRCAACHEILIDYRGLHVLSTDAHKPRYWRENARIAKGRRGSFLMADRSLESDEQWCSDAAQRMQENR